MMFHLLSRYLSSVTESFPTSRVYMKVVRSARAKGTGRGVATTIHSLRGRLATPLPVPGYITFMLRCEMDFHGC